MNAYRRLWQTAWLGLWLGHAALAQPAATEPTRPDVGGSWQNGRGSTLELRVEGRELSGHYRTAVGNASPAHDYPLQGFQNGDLLAFCVDWGNPEADGPAAASVSCWVGQHTLDPTTGEEEIHSQWHLSRDQPDALEAEELWGSVLTGSSVFRRSPATPVAPAKP